jgi:hypothetical protein
MSLDLDATLRAHSKVSCEQTYHALSHLDLNFEIGCNRGTTPVFGFPAIWEAMLPGLGDGGANGDQLGDMVALAFLEMQNKYEALSPEAKQEANHPTVAAERTIRGFTGGQEETKMRILINPFNFRHIKGHLWPAIIQDFMHGAHEVRPFVQSVHLLQQLDSNSTVDNWLFINAVPTRSEPLESYAHSLSLLSSPVQLGRWTPSGWCCHKSDTRVMVCTVAYLPELCEDHIEYMVVKPPAPLEAGSGRDFQQQTGSVGGVRPLEGSNSLLVSADRRHSSPGAREGAWGVNGFFSRSRRIADSGAGLITRSVHIADGFSEDDAISSLLVADKLGWYYFQAYPTDLYYRPGPYSYVVETTRSVEHNVLYASLSVRRVRSLDPSFHRFEFAQGFESLRDACFKANSALRRGGQAPAFLAIYHKDHPPYQLVATAAPRASEPEPRRGGGAKQTLYIHGFNERVSMDVVGP